MDVGLPIARSVFGLLLAARGCQKLFGWFRGGGGILLVLGLFQPASAAAVISVMVVAIATVHWGKDLLAPLARYAMIADGEQIHAAMYPGSIFGALFAEQTEVNVRQHALESACFVVSLLVDRTPAVHVHRPTVHNLSDAGQGSGVSRELTP